MVGLLATVCVLSHFLRPLGMPAGLSGLTHASDDRYYAVDDRGGRLYALTITLDEKGCVRSFATNRCVRLAGRVDLEGCAWDPLEKRVWVSDEADTSIRQFDPATGAETAVAPVPDVYRANVRPNRSLEALAISPDGLKMYTANEDTLRCDGEVATTNRGGVVRIQEFTRAGAGSPWTPSRQFRYETGRIRSATRPFSGGRISAHGASLSGVSALAVAPDGSLLVLEREFSPKKGFPLPTFHARLVRLELPVRSGGPMSTNCASPVDAVAHRVLFSQSTGFANYEALAPGPVLPSGARTLLLLSDAGGGAEASLTVLSLKR